HLPQPETRDQLLRLGKGPVDHGPLRAGELDTRALGARMQSLAREQHPGVGQRFVELPHLGEELLVREHARLRLLVGIHEHHESHRHASCWPWTGAAARVSARVFSATRPRSKSSPTILSMFMNSDIIFPTKLFCPSIAHVTLVPSATGAKVNVAVLVAVKGLVNSSLIPTRVRWLLPPIAVRPSPTS